jgi:hypothetical protein
MIREPPVPIEFVTCFPYFALFSCHTCGSVIPVTSPIYRPDIPCQTCFFDMGEDCFFRAASPILRFVKERSGITM